MNLLKAVLPHPPESKQGAGGCSNKSHVLTPRRGTAPGRPCPEEPTGEAEEEGPGWVMQRPCQEPGAKLATKPRSSTSLQEGESRVPEARGSSTWCQGLPSPAPSHMPGFDQIWGFAHSVIRLQGVLTGLETRGVQADLKWLLSRAQGPATSGDRTGRDGWPSSSPWARRCCRQTRGSFASAVSPGYQRHVTLEPSVEPPPHYRHASAAGAAGSGVARLGAIAQPRWSRHVPEAAGQLSCARAVGIDVSSRSGNISPCPNARGESPLALGGRRSMIAWSHIHRGESNDASMRPRQHRCSLARAGAGGRGRTDAWRGKAASPATPRHRAGSRDPHGPAGTPYGACDLLSVPQLIHLPQAGGSRRGALWP